MSKTHKDRDAHKIRKFFERYTDISRSVYQEEPGLQNSFDIPLTKDNVKQLTGLELTGTDRTEYQYRYYRRRHQHSAAHRHSAMKTRARANRRKKHSERNKVMREINRGLNENERE